jgi:hypothetical protein
MRAIYLICFLFVTSYSTLEQASSIENFTEEDTTDEFDEFRDEEEMNLSRDPVPGGTKDKVIVPGKIEVSGAQSTVSLENLWEHILQAFLPDEVITFEVPPRSQEVKTKEK